MNDLFSLNDGSHIRFAKVRYTICFIISTLVPSFSNTSLPCNGIFILPKFAGLNTDDNAGSFGTNETPLDALITALSFPYPVDATILANEVDLRLDEVDASS